MYVHVCIQMRCLIPEGGREGEKEGGGRERRREGGKEGESREGGAEGGRREGGFYIYYL